VLVWELKDYYSTNVLLIKGAIIPGHFNAQVTSMDSTKSTYVGSYRRCFTTFPTPEIFGRSNLAGRMPALQILELSKGYQG
jgi:hypothetical protein